MGREGTGVWSRGGRRGGSVGPVMSGDEVHGLNWMESWVVEGEKVVGVGGAGIEGLILVMGDLRGEVATETMDPSGNVRCWAHWWMIRAHHCAC